MIHKQYRRNGTPDLRRWIFECDGCLRRCTIRTINGWLIPDHPKAGMRIYCPRCVHFTAALIISQATPNA